MFSLMSYDDDFTAKAAGNLPFQSTDLHLKANPQLLQMVHKTLCETPNSYITITNAASFIC